MLNFTNIYTPSADVDNVNSGGATSLFIFSMSTYLGGGTFAKALSSIF